MDLIKQIYIDNGLEKLWNKYLEGKSIDVVISQLKQDIKEGRIVLPEPTPGEEEAYANIEEIIAKADAEGLIPIPGYRRGRTIELGIPDEAYEELKIEEKEVGTVEDIYTKIEEEKENKQKAEEELEKKFGPMTSWDAPELGFAGVDIDDKWRKTSITEYMTERPEDIKRYLKDTGKEKIEIISEVEELKDDQTGFVLRIDKDGELEGYDEKTGNTFNPKNLEVTGNDFGKIQITPTGEPTTPTGKAYNAIGQLGLVGQSNEGYEYKFNAPPGQGGNPGVSNIGDPDPDSVADQGTGDTGSNAANSESQIVSDEQTEFNNVPEGAWLWNVEGKLYLAYEVPGSEGEIYSGKPMYMAYEVIGNDAKKAGLLTADAPNATLNAEVNKAFFDSVAVLAGNTDQLSADIDHPFASFTDTLRTQIQVAPWLADNEAIALLAEAAVEGRTVTDAEWQTTTWWKEHTQAERDWLRTYNSDPATATQNITDSQLSVKNSLIAAGVSNAPDSLVDWIANKYVSGQWSEIYTTEQLGLFADPYAQGTRDTELENYLSSTALTGVDRTTQREREVEELFNTWLGPTLGNLTDSEKAEIAGRMRDDPDYKDTLIGSLKQSRLAAFSNYTNPELTYEDIARPWRNLTASVWGNSVKADETQGWWQDMMKNNDYATAQTTLREKGLENNIAQVTQDATGALTQALGEGLATQGVNQ